MMCWCLYGKLKSGIIEIFDRDFDVGGEGNEFYDDDDDDEDDDDDDDDEY